uniref:Protein kinase-like domain, phloem protein 2-like protein n=1 Tax=Tanacetum cinerariifolium TaxID=118510 RepID=A0A699HAK2_TANCI|nr:protein kinase-like domain, phloem protein 2-like protein [Tanacetum cinerariifolium]
MYVSLIYKLEGETETSIVYLANKTKDKRPFTAKLYQFTSNGRTFDLDIVFEDHKDDLEVEGFLFQPLEKVEYEQVLEDENLSYNNLQWTIMKEEKKHTNLLKRFKKEHKLLDNGQETYAVDKDGKKSLMLSARCVLKCYEGLSFQCSSESRFGEVAITSYRIEIEKKIESDILSAETTYAIYLICKLPQHQSICRSAKEEGWLDTSKSKSVSNPTFYGNYSYVSYVMESQLR